MSENNKCIIIVDDEPGACEFMKEYLQDRGFTVFTALDGREGLNLIKDKRPAFVFLDLRMPVMNGIEVLTELKREEISVPIAILTGLHEGEDLEKLKAFTIIDILKKPVELDAIYQILINNV